MTYGVWYCLACKKRWVKSISVPPFVRLSDKTKGSNRVRFVCPYCGARYRLVNVIEGAHIVHTIPVLKLEDDKKAPLLVPLPIALAVGDNKRSVRLYFKLVYELRKWLEENSSNR